MGERLRMTVLFVVRVLLLGFCLYISAISLFLFNSSINVSNKTLIPQSATLLENIVVIGINSVIPIFFLLLWIFRRDKKFQILTCVLLLVYFLCQALDLALGRSLNNQTDFIRFHYTTVLFFLLLLINLIHLFYPTRRIKPFLGLLPVFSAIWFYIDSLYPSLSMISGSLIFGFYGHKEVMGFVQTAIMILPRTILFMMVIPVTVFYISKNTERLCQLIKLCKLT